MLSFTVTGLPKMGNSQSIIDSECALLRDEVTDEHARQCKRALVDTDSIATGKTIRSVNWSPVSIAGVFRGQVTAKRTWIFTERGRGPGKMPISRSGPPSLRTGKATFQPLPDIRAWFVARGIDASRWWPILRSIGRKGTKGKHFLARAMREAVGRTQTVSRYRARTLGVRLLTDGS